MMLGNDLPVTWSRLVALEARAMFHQPFLGFESGTRPVALKQTVTMTCADGTVTAKPRVRLLRGIRWPGERRRVRDRTGGRPV